MAAADAIKAEVPSPEKALRGWQRAKHGSYRRFVDDETADLAVHFDPRAPTSLRSYGPPVTAQAHGVGRLLRVEKESAGMPVAPVNTGPLHTT